MNETNRSEETPTPGERVTALIIELDQALADLIRQAVADDPGESGAWETHFEGRGKDLADLSSRCVEVARRFEIQRRSLSEYKKAKEQVAKLIKVGQ